jgi:sugar-specific transcriptional regulator TrmB
LKPILGLRNEEEVLERLVAEVGLSKPEAELYLKLLKKGHIPASANHELTKVLMDRGMAILSGDGKRVIPVHPRLGIANHYRSWREQMVREINERRMRVDNLILELIPVYEAATEKRAMEEGG